MRDGRTSAVGRRPKIRCAIYTRKSHEEGLEQDFNSLHAQRDACEAYIKSQASEGMVALAQAYDDGGISGATMERPALRRLIDDVKARKVDAVVVYKVDRLTRSLKDFVRIVEIFDEAEVSFVSVTQSFNTTTSMGRLTLNMLLSFAQFEREVTSERIRDKIAASKRKGLWMGGLPSLGYDVQDRKLVINEAEAEIVRRIFATYLDLGSVRLLKERLDDQGVLSKRRTDRFGHATGGQSLSRGALYDMLQNKLYRGMIVHKGEAFAGQHPPIVDEALWRRVQDGLRAHRLERTLGQRAAQPSLLAGLVFDAQGQRLTPTHANKNGARYRYYVSHGLVRGVRAKHRDGLRLPAADLERLVEQNLVDLLRDQSALYAALGAETDAAHAALLLARAADVAAAWSDKAAADKRAILLEFIARIEVHRDEVRIGVRTDRILARLEGPAPSAARTGDAAAQHGDEEILFLICPASLQRHGMQIKLVIHSAGDSAAAPDRALLRLLGQAQRYQRRLLESRDRTIGDLAREAGVTRSYFTRVLRLSFLAPDIVKAILTGRQPSALSAKRLAREHDLPMDWHAQRAALGFG